MLISKGPANTSSVADVYEYIETSTEVAMKWPTTLDHEYIGEHTFTLTTNLRDFPNMDNIMKKVTSFKLTVTSVCTNE
jgi:hypothetical protein